MIALLLGWCHLLIDYELRLARGFLKKVQTNLVHMILNMLLIRAKQVDSSWYAAH